MSYTLSQKMKIYPNKHNQNIFKKYFGYRRYIWNKALIERNRQYKIYKEQKESGNYTQKELNKLFYPSVSNLRKLEKQPWENYYHCRAREIVFEQLDEAWNNFFNPNMPNHKMPKLKNKKDKLQSCQFRYARIKNGYIYLPNARGNKEKMTRIKLPEKIRLSGVKTQDITISFDGYNWFLSVSFKDEQYIKKEVKKDSITAIDVNIGNFNYLDNEDGQKEFKTLPNSLLKEYSNIKYYSKSLSKKREKNSNWKTSKSYQKTKTKLNKSYTKAVRIQDDILNKFIKQIVSNYKVVVIEDLNVNSMKMNKRLCKSLHKAMFGKFKSKISKKTEEYDFQLVFADRFYPSTQRCSDCGHIKTGEDKLGLYGDKHGNPHNKYVCYNPGCGVILERDENAVLNLIDYYNHIVFAA